MKHARAALESAIEAAAKRWNYQRTELENLNAQAANVRQEMDRLETLLHEQREELKQLGETA